MAFKCHKTTGQEKYNHVDCQYQKEAYTRRGFIKNGIIQK